MPLRIGQEVDLLKIELEFWVFDQDPSGFYEAAGYRRIRSAMARSLVETTTRDCEAAARRIVEFLGEPAARDLLTSLDSDDAVRTGAFRQFHECGGHEPLLTEAMWVFER